ncbi:MAG TPA: C4-type zinc ribbon domain-containing protein [Acidimicrobiales bacterium]|nr:C4-type zinc ribbon domain-containing protein [Acidimicrobiales bacterium]
MSRWDPLLAVQEQDTTADQLEHRRRTLPARASLERVMEELAEHERVLAEVEARRHALARAQQRLEDEVTALREKAAEHERTLYSGSVTNPRELQALQDEIAALERRASTLEDEVLELMEQAEPIDAELSALARTRAELDGRAESLRAEIAEAEVEIDEALQGVRDRRAELVESVEPDLLAEYERLRANLGGIAIAPLVNGHCGGCHLALSAVEVDRIKRLPSDELVYCEECGRLLAR